MLHRLWLTLLLTLSFTYGGAAHAMTGVVVRLVAYSGAIDGPIVAYLTNEEGEVIEISLLDDGNAPDVSEGDNQYSGATMVSGDSFQVTLSYSGDTHELGPVSWSDSTTPRDLIVTEGQGGLTLDTSEGMRTSVVDGATPPGGLGDGLTDPGGKLGKSLTEAPGRTPSVSFPGARGSTQDDTTLYILGGVLVLVLAVVAFLWLRNPRAGGAGPVDSRHLEALPEPGIFGAGTPSLSDGLSLWRVDLDQQPAFLGLLLQGVAQHHRVLIVADAGAALPTVHGGPLYRSRGQRAVQVADAAITLLDHPGLPVAVVVAAEAIPTLLLDDYAAVLVPDVGVIAIVSEPEADRPADITVVRAGTAWRLSTADGTVVVEEHPWGVQVTATPRPAAEPSAPADNTENS